MASGSTLVTVFGNSNIQEPSAIDVTVTQSHRLNYFQSRALDDDVPVHLVRIPDPSANNAPDFNTVKITPTRSMRSARFSASSYSGRALRPCR